MLNWFDRLLAALLPALGLAANGLCTALTASHALAAFGSEIAHPPPKQRVHPTAGGGPVLAPAMPAEEQPLADGIYHYGESAEPEQIGKAYMVFEVRQGLAIGAFYMPSSSFDCFYGSAWPQRLDLTIVSTYEQTAYTYSVPLDEFQPVPTVSENDERILRVCTGTYQERVWERQTPQRLAPSPLNTQSPVAP
ncbi:hypothetical protein [Kamptonema formosum]|uniref:hypothetical protein n=1 Tax=Kamptonema formosum TaxID=331992 RepID=UPI0003629BF6|nr:hypothetical protein [Oscillatoria sp. PCC 10802]